MNPEDVSVVRAEHNASPEEIPCTGIRTMSSYKRYHQLSDEQKAALQKQAPVQQDQESATAIKSPIDDDR